ncbi:hypothetical protein ACIOHS_31565 [Streptomyces sp. NPDC088253]|uniref:hypothetical protein n=1 Tax=Streptomyces sp. NPDC088253 TaxID=3365846 RepID=UPI003801CA88
MAGDGTGIAAFTGLALLLRELPHPVAALTLRDRLAPLADRRVLGAALTTFLVFLAFQTSFIYYTVATHPATVGDQDRLTLLLLVSGIASVGGSSAGGRLVDQWGPRTVIVWGSAAYVVLAAASPWTLRTMPTALAASALYLGVAAAGGTGSLAITLFGDRWFLLVGAGLMTVATAVATITTRTPRAASEGAHQIPPQLRHANPLP